MKLNVLMTLCVFLYSGSAFCQLTVSGKIVEESSGESLPFATVVVQGFKTGTASNVDGFFTLFNVPYDTSTLLVTYVGYERKAFKLSPEIVEGQVMIPLKPFSTSLEEVVISENAYKILKASSGISQSTISTKQLALLPSIGEVDIFRSLQLLPGVSGTNENSSGLFVRGGTPDQNLVLLDGMTVYKVDHFFGFFSAFNAKAIKDVQLYKGAFPAKYGGRTSSVVDMTGKTGSFQEAGGSLGFNLLAFNGYLEVPVSKKASLMIAGRRSFNGVLNSDVFKGLRDNLIGENEFSNVPAQENVFIAEVEPVFYFYDWNGKFSYKPTERDMITMSVYSGNDFLEESRELEARIPNTIGDMKDRALIIDIQEETDWGNTGFSGKWSRQWNPRLYTNLLVSQSEYFSKYDRDAGLALTIPVDDSTIFAGRLKTFEDNKVQDRTLRFDVEWQANAFHKFETGASLAKTSVDYLSLRNDSITVLDIDQNADYLAFYMSDTWTGIPRLTVNAGVRYAYYDRTDQYLFSPRISASYQLTDKIKLKGAYGSFYQFVNRIINENISEGSRDFWLLADGDLTKVSKSNHLIGGISYETDDWLFDVEAYYKDVADLAEFTLRFRRGDAFNPNQLFFRGDGVVRGIEFLAQKKFGQYTGWVSYSLGQVVNQFPGFNDGRKFAALHDQRHELKLIQSIDVEGWTLSATFVYGSGKPFSEPSGQYSLSLLDDRELNYIGVGDKNGSRLPAYHRLDISAHHKFDLGPTKVDLGFSVFNLYNRRNPWYFQYDFTQSPSVVTEVKYLGLVPNVSLNLEF